jgi:hypothetical protein
VNEPRPINDSVEPICLNDLVKKKQGTVLAKKVVEVEMTKLHG